MAIMRLIRVADREARKRRSRAFRPGSGSPSGAGPEVLEVRSLLSTLPPGFVDYQVVDDIAAPTDMSVAPDGRVFITEQGGRVRVVKDGRMLPTPFLTLPTDNFHERGLQSLVFDPDFANNGYVYLYYTDPNPPIHNRVIRVTADGDVARPGSAVAILELEPLLHTRHNGGGMQFGPDGKLYVSVGDDGWPPERAQALDNLFGKVLRINADGTIPEDNPFYQITEGQNRAIWALGLRNPFKMVIQPGTGRILINDVGGDQFEEINVGRPGANYGWPFVEGFTHDPRLDGPRTSEARALGLLEPRPDGSHPFDSPIYAYGHDVDGERHCAITGGAFYDPAIVQFPAEYVGLYFFADYCNDRLRTLDPETGEVRVFGAGLPSSLIDIAVSPDGGLYYLEYGQRRASGGTGVGKLHKIEFPQGHPRPRILAQPADARIPVNDPVTFAVTAFGEPTLAFQWQRNGVDIPGAVGPIYTIPRTTPLDDGAVYRVIVRNDHGAAISGEARLTVVNDRPPQATIQLPGRRGPNVVNPGAVVRVRGIGLDRRDGQLPDASFSWQVDLHHKTHTHPLVPLMAGTRSLTFTIPADLHEDGDIWYRIYLTVTDSSGLSTTTFRDVIPSNSPLAATSRPMPRPTSRPMARPSPRPMPRPMARFPSLPPWVLPGPRR